MIRKKLNIPAVLVHTVKGKQYKVNGLILSINESNDTCTMRFKGNLVENNIPMNKILINEGFLDKIKEYGKKIANYIAQKVKGFIAIVDETAQKVLPWSLNNVGNIAIQASKGQLPDGVYFAPSDTLKQTAGCGGMSIDQAFSESMRKDKEQITRFWKRVIQRAGTTSDTIEESVKYVNEKYYKESPLYRKSLNENVIYSYDDIKLGRQGISDYGVALKSKELKAQIKNNIRKQISGPLGGHSDQIPLLIWGAPGIGKTAIIKQSIKELAKTTRKPVNLNLEVIMLAGYTIENWTLPDLPPTDSVGVELRRFSDLPKTWLPVYLDTTDIEEKKRRDHYCNTCKFLNPDLRAQQYTRRGADKEEVGFVNVNDGKNEIFEGGIVFMDEYSRVMPNVQNIIMGLGNDHKFGDNYVVASKWGFIFASNRSYDEGEADSDDARYYPTAAQANRFIHVTYVPDKKEWLEWARQTNDEGEANVEPFITDFIEASPDHVWYATVTNGGYDDLLDNKKVDKLAHENESDPRSAIQDVLDQAMLKTKRMVTPRTWANVINTEYRETLKDLLDGNPEGIDGKDYYKMLVQKSAEIKKDSEGTEYKEWYGGIAPNILIDELNNIDEAYWDEWVEEKGGEDSLNPGGNFVGKRARYNMFMKYIADQIRLIIGDTSGTSSVDANSPLMNQLRDYQTYARNFTPDVYESIWLTGEMPKKFQKDDDFTPDTLTEFSETEFAKWKQFTSIRDEILDNLWQLYPGDIAADVEDAVDKIENTPSISVAEAKKLATTLSKDLSFKLNKTTVNLLEDILNIDDKKLQILMNVYQKSKFTQNLAHLACWIAKISIQTQSQRVSEEMKKNMMTVLNKYVDSDIVEKFENRNNIARQKNAKDKEKYLTELCKSGLIIPQQILSKAATFSFDKLRKK